MSNATWMSDLAAYIKDVPLLNIVLPGTHDSGTYPLSKDSRVSPDAPAFVKDIETILDDPFIWYWLHLLHADFNSIVAGWAKAQDKDISSQLEAGIRYLDCRVCRDGDVTRICHGMYAENTDVLIDAVSGFIKQNPYEIVILDFNHFYEMTAESHAKLVSKIINTFDKSLAPNTLGAGVTVGTLWENNYQVVVIYHCDSDNADCTDAVKGHPQLWPKSCIWSPWPDQQEMDKLKSDLVADLGKRLSGHPNQLFVLQGILTPNNDTIYHGLNPFKDYPRNLGDIADEVTPTVVGWVKDLWSSQPLNIIIVDRYERADLVGVAKSLNRGFEAVLNWTAKGRQYDTGSLLAVAMNNSGDIVDIHCGSVDPGNQYKHYYRVGALNTSENSINWGPYHEYDTGSVLAVAINDSGNVVDIHCGSPEHDNQYKHYYRVGALKASTQTVEWGPYYEYDTGSLLAVAMDNDGNVVDIHCGSPGPHHEHNHYYRVGALDAGAWTINWGPYHEYDTGSLLAVAMNNNGDIVDIHCGSPGPGHEYIHYYRLGTLNASAQTIEWGPYSQYDTGSLLAVAMNDSGNVVELHCGSPDDDRQYKHYCRAGTLTTNAQGQRIIDWGPSSEYDTGSYLAVAMDDDGNVVEIHCGSPGSGNENKHYYNIGKLTVQQTRNST